MVDAKNTYNLPADEVAALKEAAARRAVNREYFLKTITTPHRGDTYTFDPAIQRYNAVRVYENEFFKPTAKTAKYGMLLFVIPIFLYGYIVQKDRDQKEHLFRTGQVAYRDRLFKFI